MDDINITQGNNNVASKKSKTDYQCPTTSIPLELPVMLTSKYQIIYADPAWNGLGWNNGSGKKCPANHYKVMTDNEILTLPVREIANENAALFLWVTFPNLPLGIKTIEAWGFRYATVAFTWVKKNKKSDSWFWGCGNYTRANAEICLLGIRGSMKRKSASVHSIIDDRIAEHSKKPDTARQRIIELFGNLPRIELFARQRVDGWDAWGNELQNDIELVAS